MYIFDISNCILINHGLYMYRDQKLCKYYSTCLIVYFIPDIVVKNSFIIFKTK